MSAAMLPAGGYALLLAAAAASDLATLTIPNWMPLALIALFPVAAALAPHPIAWLSHIAAAALVLGLGISLFAWGKIGGGDVKLLAAVSLWHGIFLLPPLLLLTGISGGVLSLSWLALRHVRLGRVLAARGIPSLSLQHGTEIPYAVAIAAACWLLLPDLPLF